MAEPFVGEIRMFAGNFAPSGWAFCDGQLLAISQNDALFSLLGTIYGGDGRTTFGLPDMRGRIPIHAGTGPGLTARALGAKGGVEAVTVTVDQLPSHDHTPVQASGSAASERDPAGNVFAETDRDQYFEAPDAGDIVNLSASAILTSGGDQDHANLMPFQCIHFIIALFGIYPSRN